MQVHFYFYLWYWLKTSYFQSYIEVVKLLLLIVWQESVFIIIILRPKIKHHLMTVFGRDNHMLNMNWTNYSTIQLLLQPCVLEKRDQVGDKKGKK